MLAETLEFICKLSPEYWKDHGKEAVELVVELANQALANYRSDVNAEAAKANTDLPVQGSWSTIQSAKSMSFDFLRSTNLKQSEIKDVFYHD